MRSTIESLKPLRVVAGARLTLNGAFDVGDAPPVVSINGHPVRVAFASPRRVVVIVPEALGGGTLAVRVESGAGETAFVEVGHAWATGVHQVDNPVFDSRGRLFVTYSGSRGQETPVSIFRVTRQGSREPFASGIVNATSMALGPDGYLYVSSRFEGAVYRIDESGAAAQVASDLGVACGIAFDAEGVMYVGDRSGTVFRVKDGIAAPFASVPASIAAFHLAVGPTGDLFVTAPTLSSYDHIYRVSRQGEVEALPYVFGRPQGVAFDAAGTLHVVDALACGGGVFRVSAGGAPELVVAGSALVGVAFGPGGEMAVASNGTVYRFAIQSAAR